MKPLLSRKESSNASLPALPQLAAPPAKNTPTSPPHKTNKPSSVQRAYPWLLCTSTAVAAIFCLAYISKPVVSATQSQPLDIETITPTGNKIENLTDPSSATKISPEESPNPTPPPENQPSAKNKPDLSFEETNIRVQHVLDAEAENGDIKRIVIDVPVVYQSRNLRWTQEDAAEARQLVEALSAYQENVRTLRDTGMALQSRWDQLLERSIPTDALRADSPSLPINQANLNKPSSPSDTEGTIKLNKPTE